MADKKAVKRKKKGANDEEGPNKEETAVAKDMRFNMPTKKATMYGDEVYYFSGSKAVDFLMDSKWASGTKTSISFTHRESITHFLSRLLNFGLFNRVHLIKTEKKVKDKKKDTEKKKDDKKPDSKNEKAGDIKEQKTSDTKQEKKSPGSPKTKRDKDGKEVKKVKKKVKITLEPHEYPVFLDSDEEFYIWIYDPVSWKTFILGILLVLAIVGVCLFPLWPESIREYSWYLSVAGAIFVGAILVLAVLRYIIYGVLWMATLGKLTFWLLPNLTAECGFLESFVPLYEFEMKKMDENESKKTTEKEEEEEADEKPENPVNETTNSEQTVHDMKQPNDSEESSGSQKDDEWVKVKKGDAYESQENVDNVKC